MDIDKLILKSEHVFADAGFSSLMDIDKLIPGLMILIVSPCFSSLMDIDKLILETVKVTGIYMF